MSFLYPSFLWALTAVLVPIVIHLFNFRRYKKVYFSNVRFLRELRMETKSRSRLREILVLTARCLAVVALVLAFARPFLPDGTRKTGEGPPAVAIYIDNSLSMENVGRQGPLLAMARKHAAELVRAFGQSARFYLVSNHFNGDEQRWRTHDDALDWIETVEPSPVPRTLSEVLSRQQSFISRSSHRATHRYVLTDAQRATFDLRQMQPDTALDVSFLPFTANAVNNVVVDSCWFDSPVRQRGVRQQLFATVTSKGSAAIGAGSARLYLNDQQVAIASFSVEAGATATLQFSYFQEAGGFHFGRVEIDDHPITFDDRLFLAYDARRKIHVVLVNGAGAAGDPAFGALFGNDSVFVFDAFPEGRLNYSAFADADLVLLNQVEDLSSGLVAELRKFASGGGGIAIIPPQEVAPAFNQALRELGLPAFAGKDTTPVELGPIDPASGFFSGVFEKQDDRMHLPRVNSHYRLATGAGAAAERLLTLANGDDLLLQIRRENTSFFLFTSPLMAPHGNFSRHALFVPAFYRLALLSITQQPVYYGLHSDVAVPLRGGALAGEEPPHIVGRPSGPDIIPERRMVNNITLLFPRNQLDRPGHYAVVHNNRELIPVAFNHSRVESDLSCYSAGELRDLLLEKGWRKARVMEAGGETIRSQVQLSAADHQLWKLFIILALVFFLAESLLLRFLR